MTRTRLGEHRLVLNNPKHLLAPSLLSADFRRLEEDVRNMESCGVDWHHMDIMDAHFVPNLSFGPWVQDALKSITELPIDTHLMLTHPRAYFEPFLKAGSAAITFHVECSEDVAENLKVLRELNLLAGLSLKPPTKIEELDPYLDQVGLVLVMSVHPGFGGQSFMPEALEKITWLKNKRTERGLNFLIEVDGGINHKTGAACIGAGADVLVAGSYLYAAKDRAKAVKSLREI